MSPKTDRNEFESVVAINPKHLAICSTINEKKGWRDGIMASILELWKQGVCEVLKDTQPSEKLEARS